MNAKGILDESFMIGISKICLVFFVSFVLSNRCVLRAQTDSETEQTAEQAEQFAEQQKKIELLNRRINQLEKNINELNSRMNRITDLKISGFFDVSVSNFKNKPNIFSIGNFELDIKHNYENNFQVAAALVFDDEQGTYLGVGFIDYSVYGDSAVPRGRLFIEKGLHIQVGRFDVPLGNDWNHVSAVDRMTVTPPLTTVNLMEGVYNDVGIRLLANFTAFNATVYSTHGVDKKQTYGGNTQGFRFGFTPFSNPYSLKKGSIPVFELGLSYLYDTDHDGKESETIQALDYESKIGFLIMRGEYYQRDKTAGTVLLGYHVTTALDCAEISSLPITVYYRSDNHREENNVIASYEQSLTDDIKQIDYLTRLTTGINFNISNISFLKFEYQNYIESTERFNTHEYFTNVLYFAQLVITF